MHSWLDDLLKFQLYLCFFPDSRFDRQRQSSLHCKQYHTDAYFWLFAAVHSFKVGELNIQLLSMKFVSMVKGFIRDREY